MSTLRPEIKPKAGSSGPQCGRQVTPGTRKYFRGYFYLENILPRSRSRRETGCPWPRAPGSSRGQTPGALC